MLKLFRIFHSAVINGHCPLPIQTLNDQKSFFFSKLCLLWWLLCKNIRNIKSNIKKTLHRNLFEIFCKFNLYFYDIFKNTTVWNDTLLYTYIWVLFVWYMQNILSPYHFYNNIARFSNIPGIFQENSLEFKDFLAFSSNFLGFQEILAL